MAKVSKVNVAITGDSSGLAKATDQATARLRRLRVENERMRKGFAQTRGTVMQAGEAMSKFGVQNRAFGMAGGALGLLSLGGAGLGLGIAGAGIGAVLGGGAAYMGALANLPSRRKAAIDALGQQDLANAKSLASLGFTPQSAAAFAALPESGPGAQLSFMEGIQSGIVLSGGGTGRLATAAQVGPAAAGAAVGALTQGAGFEGAVTAIQNTIGTADMLRLIGTNPGTRLDVQLISGFLENFWSK